MTSTSNRMKLFATTVLAGAVSLAAVGAATAQTTGPNGAQLSPPTDSNDLSEVVVTGTRIVRPNLESNNPIAVLDRREIELSGFTDVADLLQRTPQVGVGNNASTTTNSTKNNGIETISLRNLGSSRTLVLINGHRQVGGGSGSTAVDVNTISPALIDRVDIVTGGSSALYGADAVAGVVNFIMRRDFEGVGFKLQYGDTEEGGGTSYYGSATVGHNFNDGRGNITLSATYSQIDPIYRYQRDYALTNLSGQPNPARSTNPAIVNAPAFIALTDVKSNVYGRLNTPTLGTFPAIATALAGNPALSLTFADGGASVINNNRGTILLSNAGIAQASSINCATCFYSYLDNLQVGQQKRGVEAETRYEIARDRGIFKSVELYGEGKYYETDGRTQSNSGTFAGTSIAYSTTGATKGLPSSGAAYPIFLDNAYIPANLRTILNATNTTTLPVYQGVTGNPRVFYVTRIDNDFGDRYTKTHFESGEVVAGIRGQFVNDWRFDAFFNYGETNNQTVAYDRNNIKFFQQIDAVINPATGQAVCRSTLTSPNNGCVPLNLFSNNGNGKNYNYSYGPVFNNDQISLTNIQINLNGTLFHWKSLGSGADLPVAFAMGYEYRRETSKAVPDVQNQQAIGFGNVSAYTAGHYSTNEFYMELNVPLLADLPFAKRVEFDASARIQDYSTTGDDWTYGGNGDWQITDDLKLRAVYAKAVRAPNINELFAAGSQSFAAISDPCDATRVNLGVQAANRLANCRALLGGLAGTPYSFTQSPATKSTFTTGNPALAPEKSTTYTAGFVFTPRFLKNFSMTVDYYDIKIKGAIASLSIASIVNNCVDSASLTNQFCPQVSRGVDGNITNVNNAVFNVASFSTRGVDVGMSYRLDLAAMRFPAWGALTFNINGTYVNNLLYKPVAGDDTTRQQGAGALNYDQPRFHGSGRVTWDYRNLSATYAVNYLGPLNLSNQDKVLDFAYERIPEYATHDVRVEYRFTGQERWASALKGVSAYVGITNFTNEAPPYIPGIFTGTGTSSLYGPVGRFYYVGVSGKF